MLAAELVGDIVVTVTGGTTTDGSIILTFSTDVVTDDADIVLAGDVAAGASATVSNNVLTIQNIASGVEATSTTPNLRVTGVRVDGIGQPVGGTVTVVFSSSGGNTITSGQTLATVISAFAAPKVVTAGDTENLVNTGDTATTTFEVEEGFPGAWTGTIGEAAAGGTGGFDLDSVLAGVPEDALVNITLDMTDTDVTGTVHLDSSDFTDIDLVEVGAVTATATQAVGDGTDLEFTIQFNPGEVAGQDPNPGALETLVFSLELVADDTTDLEFPTDAATVTLAVTAASTDDEEIPYFLSDFMPDPAANLFNIVAANCTLLSNLVNFNSAGGIRTGIAIANTSAYGGVQALTGGITFTFYPQDEDGAGTSFTYTTDGSSPGLGLNAAGELEPGGTYTVLLSEVLDAAGFDGDFSGHYFAAGDFLYCHGLNLLTDFNTFSQGYIPEVVPSIRTTGPTESLGQ